MSSWTAYGQTDSGNVRERNEDSFLVEDRLGVFAVADGMGGGKKGNVASQILVDTLQSEAESLADFARSGDPVRDAEHREEVLQRLSRIFQSANRQIFNTGGQGEMGTTADAVLLHDGAASIAHVGDSRVYLMQQGELRLLTEDHTYGNLVADAQVAEAAEAHDIELDDALTRAIGTKPHVSVDTLFVELEPGDQLILCSDGVTKHLDHAALRESTRHRDPRALVEQIVDRTLTAGGLDNTTAVAIRLTDNSDDEFDSPDTVNTLEKAEMLHHIELFEGLEDRRILQLIRYLVTVEFDEGDTLIEEGTEAGSLYVLLSGRVSVRRSGNPITNLGPGDHVGEMALAEGGRRSADVVADEPVRALQLSRREFRKLVDADPETGSQILHNLFQTSVQRLQETTDQLLLSRPSN